MPRLHDHSLDRISRLALAVLLLLVPASLAARCGGGGGPASPHEAVGAATFASPQSNPVALSPDGTRLYVANTTSNTVSVIDTGTNSVLANVAVGLDPVSVAVRPDGNEVWVANHVSDSVSVIDTLPGSQTLHRVVRTIQILPDPAGGTFFDEPVGIAFSDTENKAYVAVSSRNLIIIVDPTTHEALGAFGVRAQEPRAIAVRNGLLYVLAFESGNQTELSVCGNLNGTGIVGDQCSMGLLDLVNFAQNPNLPAAVKNIVVDPDVPDRDLFVYRTSNDSEKDVVEGIGTLLYGIAVDSNGRAYISLTDALNAENGDHGAFLSGLRNRMFSNELAAVTCATGPGCGAVTSFDLEPPNPTHATALATPYGIAVSQDDTVLVVTAAASSRVATVDASFGGGVLDTLDVGAIPRGVAFQSTGATGTAYVLNTLGNSVSVVDVGVGGALSLVTTIPVGSDPTPTAERLGRIAFNNAFASDTGTFACASCHPDGNTDQLLWRIGGGCTAVGCDPGDEPRSTMPIRGLTQTLPLHWDGTLGDPFGGGNGAGTGGTDCTLGDADGEHDCFVDLALESLAGVMCTQSVCSGDSTTPCSVNADCTPSPGGTCVASSCPLGGNRLSAQEIDDMASFLASVSYPPARARRVDDTLTSPAAQGFADFFMDQGGAGNPNTCADSQAGCHELPLGNSTNSATLANFDAPTMRGMTDRFLQFSMGPTNAEELLVVANNGINFPPFLVVPPLEGSIQWDPNQGFNEATTFGAAFAIFDPIYNVRPLNIFQMFEEASTGFSGAQGRQVTLSSATAFDANVNALLLNLEQADLRGVVNLRGEGILGGTATTLSFRSDGLYRKQSGAPFTHADLVGAAQAGSLVMTFTAHLRANVGPGGLPQPLLDTSPETGFGPTGDPPLPTMSDSGPADPDPFFLTGTLVHSNALVFVDGAPDASGGVGCSSGFSGPFCADGAIAIDLSQRPSAGTHLIQVQNPSGLLSDELPLCVGATGGCL